MQLVLFLLAGVGFVSSQVPGFGGCPDFASLSDFNMNKFLGTWYEAERYVNVFEAGTRCVKTNYTKAADGRYLVTNEIINRFTSVKRVLEGEVRITIKGSESRLNVKYPNLPVPYESQLEILDTDYDSFAVVWSCSSLGVANTQNAWILTREKLPSGTALQRAYGVLDKFKLSRTFFVKTDQRSCELAETIESHSSAGHTNSASSSTSTNTRKPIRKTSQTPRDQAGSKHPVSTDSPTKSEEEEPVAQPEDGLIDLRTRN